MVHMVDRASLIPDENLSIDDGAVAPWKTLMWSLMTDVCRAMGVRTDIPFKDLTDEEKETPFAKGMDMVYKQTIKMLEDLQVKPIEAVGSEFNPEFHNAVMHVEDDSQGENIIVEEFEKGYTYRDVVIRHSMVKVAN